MRVRWLVLLAVLPYNFAPSVLCEGFEVIREKVDKALRRIAGGRGWGCVSCGFRTEAKEESCSSTLAAAGSNLATAKKTPWGLLVCQTSDHITLVHTKSCAAPWPPLSARLKYLLDSGVQVERL